MNGVGRILAFSFLIVSQLCSQADEGQAILTGAQQPDQYLPLLAGRKTGLVVNHTAMVDHRHLLDFLLENGVPVVRLFAPEHGFRGGAAAGEKVADGIDPKTGVRVVSLYGKTHKPTPAQLEGLDILVFDMQDVGCRFYTYLSTLALVIEACAESNLPLLVLDRPNPNGDYVAGPLLEPQFRSFVGMVPVPVVHGCTLGEMALMIEGEKWHKAGSPCNINVIRVLNYCHSTKYDPPVPPSPNLPNYQAVRLYPSLCLFEATTLSIGRGTEFPFQVIGGPHPGWGSFSFIPREIPGVAINPVNAGKKCFGIDLRELDPVPAFTLSYFIDFYSRLANEKEFLNNERWFNLLLGTDKVLAMIRAGKNADEIEASWAAGLANYMKMRSKYLLYPDFQ